MEAVSPTSSWVAMPVELTPTPQEASNVARGASGGGPGVPPRENNDSPVGSRNAARILARYGGDRSWGSRTGLAVERFFSTFHRRFDPLFGKGGYRALIEHAHFRAMEEHPLLGKWPVLTEGHPYFEGLGDLVGEEDPAEVWESAVALTRHFLELVDGLARRGEMDGLEDSEVWGELGRPTGGEGEGNSRAHDPDAVRSHRPWRVLVMDRDLATCQAISRSLDDAPDFQVVDTALTPEEVLGKVKNGAIDFIVASGHLPASEVLDVCQWLRRDGTEKGPRVVVSGLPEDHGVILRFLEAGAAAVTLAEFSLEGLRLNIRLLARGEAVLPLRLQHLMIRRLSEMAELVRDRGMDPEALSRLTPREREVLDLLGRDLTNRQIARRLYITEGTVKGYVHQVLRKLRVRGREEAVKILRLEGTEG